MDSANLIRFIKKAKRVQEVSIMNTRFNLEFFEELCQIQSICYLFLSNAFPEDIDPLDVSFLLNLKNPKAMKVTDFDDRHARRRLRISIKQFEKFIQTARGSLSIFELGSGSNFAHLVVFGGGYAKLRHNNFIDPDDLNDDDEMHEFESVDEEELVSYLENLQPKEYLFFI